VDFSGKFLYVANQNDNDISEYSIDQTTGALTPLAPATVATGKGADIHRCDRCPEIIR
jgi:6-phosphogluconolactonase